MSGCYPYNSCQCHCHKEDIVYPFGMHACCENSYVKFSTPTVVFNENKNVSPLIEKIQELENKIKELESSKARADIVAQEHIKIMERIDKLEKKEQIENKIDRIYELEIHKNYQIDSNRKIFKRVDEIEYRLKHIIELPSEIDIRLQDVERKLDKAAEKLYVKPHRCPVCDGQGGTVICGVVDEQCNACEGKGIVWG